MKKRKWINVFSLVLIFFLIMGEGLCIYKLYRYNLYQEKRNLQYESDINALKFAVSVSNKIEWEDEDYNYLALGNSITKHEVCSYWFNEIGMAATSEQNDYFHIVCSELQNMILWGAER